MGVAFARTAVKDQSALRDASLVPRSAPWTACSLRLPLFYGGAGAPPFSRSDSDFTNFPQVLEVMLAQKNRSASSVSRNVLAMTQERPFEVTFERCLISLRKDRPG
jgi:hypothetical protein